VNPSGPRLRWSYSRQDQIKGVAIDRDTLYVNKGGSGIEVINITSVRTGIGSPTLVSVIDSPGTVVTTASENYLYAGGSFGLRIFDATNRTNPTLESEYTTPGSVQDMVVEGNNAYIVGSFGLQILDVSSSENPILLGTYNNLGTAWSVKVNGDHVYVQNNVDLTILDASNKTKIIIAKKHTPLIRPKGLALFNDNVVFGFSDFTPEIVNPRLDGLGLWGTPPVPGKYRVMINGNNGTHLFSYEYIIEVLKRPDRNPDSKDPTPKTNVLSSLFNSPIFWLGLAAVGSGFLIIAAITIGVTTFCVVKKIKSAHQAQQEVELESDSDDDGHMPPPVVVPHHGGVIVVLDTLPEVGAITIPYGVKKVPVKRGS